MTPLLPLAPLVPVFVYVSVPHFGSFMVDWDDFLPPVPADVRAENALFVAERLRDRLGGRVVTSAG